MKKKIYCSRRKFRHPANDIIYAGAFRLHNYAKGKFWLSTEDGEGMETSEMKIAKLLKEFYEREF
jgi:hypothetical protein